MKRFRDIKTLLLTGLAILSPELVLAQSNTPGSSSDGISPGRLGLTVTSGDFFQDHNRIRFGSQTNAPVLHRLELAWQPNELDNGLSLRAGYRLDYRDVSGNDNNFFHGNPAALTAQRNALVANVSWQYSPELRINSEMQYSQSEYRQPQAEAMNLLYGSADSRRRAWEFTLASMYTTEHQWKVNLQYRFTDRQPDFLLHDPRGHQFSLAARISF